MHELSVTPQTLLPGDRMKYKVSGLFLPLNMFFSLVPPSSIHEYEAKHYV